MSEVSPVKLPPYVYLVPSRHGRQRLYFWRGRSHRRIRIREPYNTAEFWGRYAELKAQSEAGAFKTAPRNTPKPGTVGWLWHKFSMSTEHNDDAGKRTRHVTKLIIEAALREPIKPGGKDTIADCPLACFDAQSIMNLRDRRRDRPEAANNLVKRFRTMFKWGVGRTIDGIKITTNPARDVPRLRPRRVGGFPVWKPEDLDRFEERHPIGTKAHLALGLLQYLGVRRSDVVCLGWQHMPREGGNRIKFRMFKGRERRPIDLELVVSDDLRRIIDAGPTGELTFLVTEYGKPFSVAGFGNWFRARCDEAGLTGLSAHGVRKAAATRAAEGNATPHQLMAQFGWLTLTQAMLYTQSVDRAKLAAPVALLLARNKAG